MCNDCLETRELVEVSATKADEYHYINNARKRNRLKGVRTVQSNNDLKVFR